MESATALLHRLTSYQPGREWDVPVEDPRVRQDLVVNDLARLPWFFKRYPLSLAARKLRRISGPDVGQLNEFQKLSHPACDFWL